MDLAQYAAQGAAVVALVAILRKAFPKLDGRAVVFVVFCASIGIEVRVEAALFADGLDLAEGFKLGEGILGTFIVAFGGFNAFKHALATGNPPAIISAELESVELLDAGPVHLSDESILKLAKVITSGELVVPLSDPPPADASSR